MEIGTQENVLGKVITELRKLTPKGPELLAYISDALYSLKPPKAPDSEKLKSL
jgi:hypothetical protein